jgi:cytochrome c553
METLRELDPIMRNLFEDDPAALAAWLTARRIERAPRRKKREDEEPPAPAQPNQ